jgi:hypothetical protein
VEEEENQPEENGFSNRHVSTTFIPPLTTVESGLSERKAEPLFAIQTIKSPAILKAIPDPGWSHFGIND